MKVISRIPMIEVSAKDQNRQAELAEIFDRAVEKAKTLPYAANQCSYPSLSSLVSCYLGCLDDITAVRYFISEEPVKLGYIVKFEQQESRTQFQYSAEEYPDVVYASVEIDFTSLSDEEQSQCLNAWSKVPYLGSGWYPKRVRFT